jgi:hypothetical protein
MAAALPFIGPITSVLGMLNKPDAPKTPKAKVAPAPDDKAQRRAGERSAQRKYMGTGRVGTMLSEESGLG